MGVLNPKSLKEYFTLKLNSCRSYSHLRYEYVNIRRVCNFSYFMVNDYPEIPLLMDDSQKEIKKGEVSTETIRQAIEKLRSEEDHENYLLLLLVSRYYLYPGTLTLVRFEDFGTDKNGKRVLNIFVKGRRRYEAIYVDEETFEAVRGLKQFRLSCKKQQYETKRGWGKNFKVKGWFIFPVQRCSIGRRLQNGFNLKIPEFSATPQKIISAWRRDFAAKSETRAQRQQQTSILNDYPYSLQS